MLCLTCGKKYHDNVEYCPYCHAYNNNYQRTQQTIRQKPVKAVEYRRTCTRCGTVWHSLIEREKVLDQQSTCYHYTACCNMCNPEAMSQYSRNRDEQMNELLRLKKCPKCGSSAFHQEEIGIKE